MKTKNLFLVTMVALFGVVSESSGQTTNLLVPANDTTHGFSNILLGGTVGSNIPNGNSTRANVFIGHQSAFSTTTNSLNNVFVGYNSGYGNTTGSSNVFVGSGSGFSNTNSWYNTYVGSTSGGTGTENSYFGYGSGTGSTGNWNLFLGYESGYNNTGSNNILIGHRAGKTTSYSNRLVISGRNSTSDLIFGEFDNRKLRFNVDYNNGVPFSSFVEVNGNPNYSGLRFTNLTSNVLPGFLLPPNGRVLTVNQNGDVVLTTDQGSGGSTLIQAGTNVTVTGTGVTGNPYVISSTATNCNLYSCDGNLTTTTGLRTVTMGNNNLFFQTNPAFDGNGRVYIGASSNNFTPITATSRYRLFVEGGILTERVKVATNGTVNWADYVFADDYKLLPLNEVETFITKNNHLPGIESAETLSKEGLDLGDMQAKQMAKIEELTLYVIQQNKEIEELKVQVKELLGKNK